MSPSAPLNPPPPPLTWQHTASDGGGEPADIAAALRHLAQDNHLPSATRVLLHEAANEIRALRSRITTGQLENKHWQELFDALPDPVLLISNLGLIHDINRSGLLELGFPREQIIGQPLRALYPDAPPDHMLPILAAVASGKTHLVESRAIRDDRTYLHVEVRTGRYRSSDDGLLISVARNIESRADMEIRYRELLELIDKGIVIHDDDSNLLYANSAALRILGMRTEQALAGGTRHKEDWVVLREDGTEMPYREYPMVRAMVDGRTVQSTVCGILHRRSGLLLWVSVTSAPQYAAGATTPHRVLSLFSDITAIKRDSAMFGRVQALAHVGGWEWNSTTDRLYLTEESRRILAANEDVPLTMASLLESLIPAARDQLQIALLAAISEHVAFDLELMLQNFNHCRWFRINGEPMRDGPMTNRINGTLQDITERKHSEENLRVQARSDPLTSLMNRDAVMDELDVRLSDPERSAVAVLYIDLDRFKIVNDVLGHAAGDQVLIAATERIQRAVNDEGLTARLGGDEFLVLCQYDDDHARPQRIAESILRNFGEVFSFDGNQFAITASIGIAFAPLTDAPPHVLIQNADMAMYDSKRRIRNGYQLFTPELAQLRQEAIDLETSLHQATDEDEFKLVFQPQVDMTCGRIVAAEALIRWKDNAIGHMRPDRFIAHAEYSGDIVRIGGWVLHEACRQIAAWRDSGLGLVRVSVNVSYRQFLNGDLPKRVEQVLSEHGLPGSALELEFTERVLIEDIPETLQTLARLRELGVRLVIDDFGEGYSALNYLRRIPIHGLKISQSFVSGLPDNPSDVAVCQAVVGIARSLGLELVAEGIESEAQRDYLLSLGVLLGQGFWFSAGVPAAELTAMLTASLSNRPESVQTIERHDGRTTV